jgi:PKHD-type hydroxylase
MLVCVPQVLDPEQVRSFRDALRAASWADGRMSAGYLSQSVKNNHQLSDTDPVARQLGESILEALERNAVFTAAALPLKVLPPLFNRYAASQSYGPHIDGAVRPVAGTAHRIRTDLSATLFLSDRDSYDGGDLVIRDNFGERSIRLAAGDMLLYPGTSVHRVTPVTRGERLAAFFWIQSMVRDNGQRAILFDLDNAIQRLAKDMPEHAALVELAGVYHNLLRRWADTG